MLKLSYAQVDYSADDIRKFEFGCQVNFQDTTELFQQELKAIVWGGRSFLGDQNSDGFLDFGLKMQAQQTI
jgi:hypothetical protein